LGRPPTPVPNSLKFFHFGMQCPYNQCLVELLKEVCSTTDCTLQIFDIAENQQLCRTYQIYGPNLLIVDDHYRWNGPFSRDVLLTLLRDEKPVRSAYCVQTGTVEFKGRLLELNDSSVVYTSQACFMKDDHSLCQAKAEWVRQILQKTGLPHIGYLNMDGERCVGGAEFLPAELVPYPIPGLQPKDAFITCSFLTHEDYDYKSFPLRALLTFLKDSGFGRALIVASTEVLFPNGTVDWYCGRGFSDLGHLAYEATEHADMHLLEYVF